MRTSKPNTRVFHNIKAQVQLYDSIGRDYIQTDQVLELVIAELSITPDFTEDTNNFEAIISRTPSNTQVLKLMSNFTPRSVDVDNTGFRLFDIAIPAENFLYSEDEGAIKAMAGKVAVYRLCSNRFNRVNGSYEILQFFNEGIETSIYNSSTWALEARNLTMREIKEQENFNAMFVANTFVPSRY